MDLVVGFGSCNVNESDASIYTKLNFGRNELGSDPSVGIAGVTPNSCSAEFGVRP
jgi:hypothetical protein